MKRTKSNWVAIALIGGLIHVAAGGQTPAVGQCVPGWSDVGGGVGVPGNSLRDVKALAVFDDGTGPALYAGGTFTTAGGVAASRIAKWDGTTWSPLGSGITLNSNSPNTSLDALAVFDDGAGPALYASGWFDTAGGVSVNSIARWDGTTWSPLGSGFSLSGIRVQALTVFDDGNGPALYASGQFTNAGGKPAREIARWNGSAWSPLGSGLLGRALDFAIFDDGTGPALYAGGGFATAGGVEVNNIARWQNFEWSPLFTGTNSTVNALAVFDDATGPALYLGGLFTTAGGVQVSRIARWDPVFQTYLPLSSGTSWDVHALTVFNDGAGEALYAGGKFSVAGGQTVNKIARWDGAAWSALDSGIGTQGDSGEVNAIVEFDDGSGPALFVGGTFTEAGGVSVSNIAKWQVCPSPLRGDVNLDLVVDALDAPLMAVVVIDPSGATGPQLLAADTNGDGTVDGRDIETFVEILLAG